ncbi:hypothetical protein CFP59_07993 [Streptomyces malaysiensis subsp. malaysiensis]|uniref:Uncharacterized protein n=2 Tax=Streptomyces malaysiensis TaxID=92644 RepID=A0ABX6VZ90_STRMQ|nr:hypothetical protein CFP59_07993 [Streptomyces sp. M56]PNG95298.1 hypothetical protein SMF913_11323 [Streptomyces malaysiensis]QPI54618.1 hypothetical protein I1A49_06485 [Streptomyces solisilvae]SCG04414.1 hypothetical protein GA0115260_107095 [Streptomyces sp. MnatMP-M27]
MLTLIAYEERRRLSLDLSSVIAATTQWLIRAYPAADGAMNAALAEAQARQAVTVAAWLRYTDPTDASLVALIGPGGSFRLDWLVDAEPYEIRGPDGVWRTCVDEVVASWAAALLTCSTLASEGVAALAECEHGPGSPGEFRRLTAPDTHDRRAAPFLRHPDLMACVAELHRPQLLERLGRLHSDDQTPTSAAS